MVGRFFFFSSFLCAFIDYLYLCSRNEIFDLLRMNGFTATAMAYRAMVVVNGLQITTTNTTSAQLAWIKLVVNSLQITTTYTFAEDLEMTVAVVNSLQITTTYTNQPPTKYKCYVVNSLQITTTYPTSRSCSFHSLLWIAYRLYALTPILCNDLDPQGLWIAHRLLPLTPSLVRYSIAQSCEWLADYYQQHPTMHLDRGCGVVNSSRITTINTGRYQGKLSQAIVNDSQIICTYTFLTHRAPAGGLWMAYRLRPLTPLIKQSNVNSLQITIINTLSPSAVRSRIVVNSLQITITYTATAMAYRAMVVVNGLQITVRYTWEHQGSRGTIVVNGLQIATINTWWYDP